MIVQGPLNILINSYFAYHSTCYHCLAYISLELLTLLPKFQPPAPPMPPKDQKAVQSCLGMMYSRSIPQTLTLQGPENFLDLSAL